MCNFQTIYKHYNTYLLLFALVNHLYLPGQQDISSFLIHVLYIINSPQPQWNEEEVKSVLHQHIQNTVVEEDDPGLRIAVRRRHIWRDSKLVLCRPNNVYSTGMQITFVSEAAVDEGGPRREYFRLVLAEIANNNSLFDGHPQQRVVRHNLIELAGNSYFIVGRVIALSLIYGGPAPHFFSRATAEYVLGITPYTFDIKDIPDYVLQQSLLKVCEIYTV